MINPIADAYNFFVNIFVNLPAPVQYFTGLAFVLIVISTLVNMIFRG